MYSQLNAYTAAAYAPPEATAACGVSLVLALVVLYLMVTLCTPLSQWRALPQPSQRCGAVGG